MYVLHHFPASQHARRVAALLDVLQLDHTISHVALPEGAHMAPPYLAINPNHQVPTLIDGELILTESNAILRYICNKEGRADWYPTDPVGRARVDQWLDWNQCRLAPPVVDIVFNKVFMGPAGDQAAIARGEAKLPEVLGILEAQLQRHDFVTGEAMTIADLSIASNITHLDFAKATPQQPGIVAWLERLKAVPGFAKTLPPQ